MKSLAGIRGYVQGSRAFRFSFAVIASAITLSGGQGARAGFAVSGNSSGGDVIANLTLVNTPIVTANINILQNTAPGIYNTDSNVASGNVNLQGLSGSLGALDTSIASNIAAGVTSGMTTASTSVGSLSLNILPVVATSLLSITDPNALTTTSTVMGSYGSLTASATTSTLSGLSIKVLGLYDVTSLVEATPGVLVDVSALTGLAGLKIGVNVQQIGGNGTTFKSITTDNILISLTGVSLAGIGVVNGTIAIGQSEASMSVPEPASVVMMGLGLGLVGFVGTHRSKKRQLQVN